MLDVAYVDSFKEYLKNVRCASDNTISSYVRDITQFAAFLNAQGVDDITEVSADDAQKYLSWIVESGRSPATVSRCIVSIKSFFNRMTDDGYFENNPVAGISSPISGRNALRLLSSEEIRRLFDQLDGTDVKSCRDKAMLDTLYATGIRVSELVALDISDVNLSTGLITCRNGKERTIPIYEEAIKSIGIYLSFARESTAASNERALFVNVHGKRMTRQGFWKILKAY